MMMNKTSLTLLISPLFIHLWGLKVVCVLVARMPFIVMITKAKN